MKRKLKSQCGETLIESLVSLLIAVLSIGMLASCITASAYINRCNREADKKYKEDLQRAESFDASEAKPVEVELRFGTGTQTIDVTLYGGEDGSFAAYQSEVSGP